MPKRSYRSAFLVTAALLLLPACSLFTGCRWGERWNVSTQKSEPVEPVVRVKIAGPAPAILVGVDGPFTIYSFNGKAVLQRSWLGYTPIRLDGSNLLIGSIRVPIDDFCDVVVDRNGSLSIERSYYRGNLRLHRLADGRLLAVNYVPIEGYLKGVLAGELPNRFAPEAFKAQAITARTFALYEKYTAPSRKKWDVVATEGSQMYLGRAGESPKALDAVEKTRGIVLTAKIDNRGWKIFPTYYSSTCGGRTQSAIHLANIDPRIRPLQGNVVCNGCTISPHCRWTNKTVPASEIVQAINTKGASPSPMQSIAAIQVLERAQNCRITKVQVTDSANQHVVVSGERFRLIVGSRKMPSTWCDLNFDGQQVVFTDGHGLGHGVGMCQYGAEGCAQRGYTAKEILELYYPHARLVRAY